MESVVLIVHIILAISIVAVVLIQPSEGGGLGGMGGGGGQMGGLMTQRGAANLMTRLTAFLVAGFILTSLVLAILAGNTGRDQSILDVAREQVSDEQTLDGDNATDTLITPETDKPEIPVTR